MVLNIVGNFLLYLSTLVSFIGSLIIAYGALTALYKFILANVNKKAYEINDARLEFGYNIIFGLEFMVASDIIESIVRRDYYDLGILALLVLIRTFLSYFLNKELEASKRK